MCPEVGAARRVTLIPLDFELLASLAEDHGYF